MFSCRCTIISVADWGVSVHRMKAHADERPSKRQRLEADQAIAEIYSLLPSSLGGRSARLSYDVIISKQTNLDTMNDQHHDNQDPDVEGRGVAEGGGAEVVSPSSEGENVTC